MDIGLSSRLLSGAGFRHAFFTRRGGVSPAPFDALNTAASVGDDPGFVRENLARAAAFVGVDASRLFVLSQVHGVVAHELHAGDEPPAIARREGDILLSREAGIACGVRSADCVPILVADPSSGAVAAIHSGWRGTVANAAGAGVSALRAALGHGGDAPLLAAIGPHIEACCFEVGEDVAEALAGASSADRDDVVRVDERTGRPRVALRRIVRAQLEAAGLPSARIDDVPGCSVCDPARFFSHRRDAAKSGRLLSAIVGRGPDAGRIKVSGTS